MLANCQASILCVLLWSSIYIHVGVSLCLSHKQPTRTLTMALQSAVSAIGTAKLDWPNLGFEYRQTDSFVKITYKDGKWGDIRVEKDPLIKVHIGATALHYGQACFEGLKAFHCKVSKLRYGAVHPRLRPCTNHSSFPQRLQDGKVRIFRPQENSARITRSCERICMPPPPMDLFLEACKAVVRDNLAYVPPYGTGGALYIRPVLFGSSPRIGLQPAEEYQLVIMALPVADYYKGGLTGVSAVVIDDFDRAAPRGVGSAKVAGNYAADLLPNMTAKKKGYPIGLYLDAKTNKYVEEFSTSNFLAIDKKGVYVTPKSDAILASVTNKSLMDLATDAGILVERRQVSIEEVMSGGFNEIAACGTAVVVTPVSKVIYQDKVVSVGSGDAVGPVMRSLYERVRGIQKGELPDKFGWMVDV